MAVSSILARGDSDLLERKRVQVNRTLQKSLADNEIDFIEHEVFDNDWRFLLYDDGIHLNDDGTNVLGNDFVNYINNVLLLSKYFEHDQNCVSDIKPPVPLIESKSSTYYNSFSTLSQMSDTLTCPLALSPSLGSI